MKVLITGAKGFIGRNLISYLEAKKIAEVLPLDVDSKPEELIEYTKDCDFVFHLAGVNRPQKEEEFMEGNYGFTKTLLEQLKLNNNKAPILITSSIQALQNNPYGLSKKAGEDALLEYGREEGVKVYVYRLPNVFGKWCRPNYNSVVATFCHNIAHDLPITVNDPTVNMNLVYVDDVVDAFVKNLSEAATANTATVNTATANTATNNVSGYCEVPVTHQIALGDLADLIRSFRMSRTNLFVPNMADPLVVKLYSTYLSYLESNDFSYPLRQNCDERGSFTEIIKSFVGGQVSVNVSKPGITKGNHWHRLKNEKFLVVSGTGIIRFRKIGTEEVIEYHVSGDHPVVVDIPIGYTHNISNTGDTDMVTLMWVNQIFDPENPDTYFLEV